jgi:hypothetical protein
MHELKDGRCSANFLDPLLPLVSEMIVDQY